MKKFLLALLTVVLALSLCLVACGQEEVAITFPNDLVLEADGEPAEYIKVTVNGKETKDAEVKCELIDGKPIQGDLCSYRVTCTYNEKEYTKTIRVNHLAITVLDTLELKVGETPDFNGHVKVVVGGKEVSNPTVTAELVSGNPNEEGRCTYRITYTSNGKNYTKNGSVNFAADKVELTANNMEEHVSNSIDWQKHVTVTVNGTPQINPTLKVTVKSGTEGVVGDVVYTITYNYDGTDYTKDVTVTYIPDEVVFTIDDLLVRVDTPIVWNEHITVTVNGEEQNNPTLDATVKSGTEGVVGDVVYTVKYNYNNVDYSTEVTVTYTDVDPQDTNLIEQLFANEYDSYAVDYCYYEVQAPTETDVFNEKVVLGATSLYQIDYTSNNANNPQQVGWYLSINVTNDALLYYFDNGTADAPNWQYNVYSLENDQSKYSDYLPYGYAPYDVTGNGVLPISKLCFLRQSDTKFIVKKAYLAEVAELLFPWDYNAEYTAYTKIELETDGTHLTKVTGYYTNEMYAAYDITFDCVVSYAWSDINATSVTLPADATEYEPYVKPEKGQPLSAEQTAALTEALAKTYENVSYQFIDIKDDGWYSFNCNGKYTANATYDNVQQFYMYGGEPNISASQRTLFVPNLDGTTGIFYSFYNTNDDYYSQNVTSTIAYETWYISFANFHFTSDMFGVTTDGTYVITADAIARSSTVTNVFNNIGWGVDQMHPTTKLLTFTFKLDEANNVTEWFFAADCVLADENGAAGDAFHAEMTCVYSDFGTTTIEIPGVFNTTEIADATAVNEALTADYSNVTITENGNGYTMYFVGDSIRVDGFDVNSSGMIESTWQKDYVYKSAENKYYEILGGEEVERAAIDESQDCVFYNVLKFDFAQLVDHLKYNAATDTYICHVADFAQYSDEFAYYWKGFFGETTAVDDIELTIKDGKVVQVRMYVTVTETTTDEAGNSTTIVNHNTMSATLSEFGTTTMPDETTTA